jgi:hypothetical protein
MPLHKSDVPPMAKAKADFNHFFMRPSIAMSLMKGIYLF